MVMEHQSVVMNRGTATQASFRENILIFNMHPHPPTEIPQPQSRFRHPLSAPPDYLFNIPVVFSVAVVTPHDLSRKVEIMSACCLKDFIPVLHPLMVFAVGNVSGGLTDEGNVPTGLVSE